MCQYSQKQTKVTKQMARQQIHMAKRDLKSKNRIATKIMTKETIEAEKINLRTPIFSNQGFNLCYIFLHPLSKTTFSMSMQHAHNNFCIQSQHPSTTLLSCTRTLPPGSPPPLSNSLRVQTSQKGLKPEIQYGGCYMLPRAHNASTYSQFQILM